MLKIENLQVEVAGELILQGLDLTINPGETHAIMGPNGSGKSTLGYVLAGKPGYDMVGGSIQFQGRNLADLSVVERAELGLFLGMQYPIELPGVNNTFFLRQAYNKKLEREGKDPLDAMDFLILIKEKMAIVGMDQSFLNRNVNEGFSGGEKKRNEVLQMLLLEPHFVILDELDSGLDIDALAWVGKAVNVLKDKARSFLVITHYQRLLNHIVPDQVHVLSKGKIIKSGDKSLALKLEEQGYAWLGIDHVE
jgi:Fe-S cluster assembly ATP-binding protein